MGVLRLAGRRQLRLFLRRDAYGRFISCLVYLPRDRFTTAEPAEMQEILLRELNGIGVDYTTRVSESTLARVHFIVRTDPANPPGEIDVDALAEQLADATRLWDDDFRLVLERKLGDEQAKALFAPVRRRAPGDATRTSTRRTRRSRTSPSWSCWRSRASWRCTCSGGARTTPTCGSRSSGTASRWCSPPCCRCCTRSACGSPTSGRTRCSRADGTIYLYDFGLQLPAGRARRWPRCAPHVENAFAAAWRGEAEVDGFNELVLRAGLTWRQVVVLRAYAKYLRQAGTVFSQEYMESTFIAVPGASPRCSWRCSRPGSTRALQLSDEDRDAAGQGAGRRRSAGSSTRWPASTRTGSCAPTSP